MMSVAALEKTSMGFMSGGPGRRFPDSMAMRKNVTTRLAVQTRSSYKVDLQMQNGDVTTLDVPEGESILSVALDQGLDMPHDCKLGVCMNCAAKITSGEVDQSAGMLRDDVQEKGYALLCISIPESDVSVRVIEEEELLAEVMD